MVLYQRIRQALLPYELLDPQIAKYRLLAQQYKAHNIDYYGDYLSSILFE
jgi:hypothetical protein